MSTTTESFASRALRTLWRATVLVVGLPALVSAFSAAPAVGPQSPELLPGPQIAIQPAQPSAARKREARDLAVRLRARFRETLDFEPLMDEFFSRDAPRRNASWGPFKDYLSLWGEGDDAIVAGLSDAELRRAYVAYLNLYHLNEEDRLRRADPDSEEIPPSVMQEVCATHYFRALQEETSMRIASRDDLMAWVLECEQVCDAYRAALPRRDAASVSAPKIDVATSDADSGYTKLGVPEGETVYEVCLDGACWYSCVEERGTLRVVTTSVGAD